MNKLLTSNANENPPAKGGLLRLRFNGGETKKYNFNFPAISANIDNWSPYWYYIANIEVYIPPYQHNMNVVLPLVKELEFIPQAPPGLDQQSIVLSSALSGNSDPVIVIVNSQSSNNDAGFSALEQASNIANSVTIASIASGQVILSEDLTLYNGLYINITSNGASATDPQGMFTANFFFRDANGVNYLFYQYHFYSGESKLFTVPKLGKELRVTLVSDTGVNVLYGLQYRPFQGYADFNKETFNISSGTSALQGERQQIATSGVVSFNVDGKDNVIIVIKPVIGAVAFQTTFRCFVQLINYANNTAVSLHSRVFKYGDGTFSLTLPVFNILQSVADAITVFVQASAAATIDVSLHDVPNPAALIEYQDPIPYTFCGFMTINAASQIVFAIPITGTLVSLQAVVITPPAGAGINLQWGLGDAGGLLIPIGWQPGGTANSIIFDSKKIPVRNTYPNLWVLYNPAGPNILIMWTLIIE